LADARPREGWVLAMLIYTVGIWGANVVMIKVMAAHFEAVQLAAIRTVVAFAFIAAIARVLGFRAPRVSRRQLAQLAAAAFLMVYAHQILLTRGLAWSTATNGGLALSLNPLLSVLLGALLFGERLGGLGITGVLLGFAGAAVVILNRGNAQLQFHGVGDALLIASMLVYVAAGAFMRQLSSRVNAVAITWYMHLLGGVMLVAHAALLPHTWTARAWAAGPTPWFLIAVSGLLSTALGGLAWSYGIARLGLGRTSAFLNLLPLSTLATAVACLGEVVLPAHVAGFVLVLAGTWLANRSKSNEPLPLPDTATRPAT
jgi:drug/metabolite transporter (DMT)-like permease